MLKPENDPMGHAITDYYETGSAGNLFVYSDICETDEIPVPYMFRTFKEMPTLEQKALNLCHGEVLDVGAAAGAHSLWLQNNGINTSAIDISRLSVNIMKKRGIKNVHCCNINTLSADKKYDTLLLLMNGTGLAGTLDNLSMFLKQCSSLLKSGGQILIDSSDLIYLFDSLDEIPKDYYYGEVEYQIVYKDIISKSFNWLFVDYNRLKLTAETNGMKCSRIMDGKNFHYLARIIL